MYPKLYKMSYLSTDEHEVIYEDYKFSRLEFNDLTKSEKRKYILQDDMKKTLWWVRFYIKLILVCTVISFIYLVYLKYKLTNPY